MLDIQQSEINVTHEAASHLCRNSNLCICNFNSHYDTFGLSPSLSLALIFFILNRSVKNVWSTETLRYYGSKAARGTPLPQGYSDIKDDPHQMGGDFIIDNDVKLKFVYRSKTPSDRPSVDQILEVLNHGI